MTAGTASPPAATDRSDFTHVLASGSRVGAAIGAAVIAYILVSRQVPAGIARALLQGLIVLFGAVAASLLPARFATARGAQGIAGAAAIGLWGTIVFMAIDIVVLRPVKAYPWTWDAVGGGSTWWYLPIWWMLGTFVAWMGGLLTAGWAARGRDVSIRGLALPLVFVAAVIAVAGVMSPLHVYLPVAVGASFTVVLTVFAVVAIARKT
jgi:hypothetical protein